MIQFTWMQHVKVDDSGFPSFRNQILISLFALTHTKPTLLKVRNSSGLNSVDQWAGSAFVLPKIGVHCQN